ncbi:hypothetical protein K0M31_009337 [Melipona bicolor]|uniref:Uncharacterized protein n=1 Tax=Melipona bicolor TaxID=60889 RepID=A0AA40FPC9_9HYME|nr:hypothetical protein K0M31_009337 [Melipona bicolor]
MRTSSSTKLPNDSSDSPRFPITSEHKRAWVISLRLIKLSETSETCRAGSSAAVQNLIRRVSKANSSSEEKEKQDEKEIKKGKTFQPRERRGERTEEKLGIEAASWEWVPVGIHSVCHGAAGGCTSTCCPHACTGAHAVRVYLLWWRVARTGSPWLQRVTAMRDRAPGKCLVSHERDYERATRNR